MPPNSILHPHLSIALHHAYAPSGLRCTHMLAEEESKKYGASTFELNGQRIKFRVANITPKKVGQFVTLWKRVELRSITPLDVLDPFELVVVSVCSGKHYGQFVFPKTVLGDKGFVSQAGLGGKLAMRVYPPWDMPDNLQAKKSQAWQLNYFLKIPLNGSIDTNRVQSLFLDASKRLYVCENF